MPERIAKLETQVEAIKDDVNELKGDVKEIHSRITTGNREIVEKIDAMDNKIENRLRESAENSTKQHAQIEQNLRADINKVTNRVDVLERWRFMIVGGAIALGYLISHLEIFSKLLK